MMKNIKLELTWIGKDKRPRLEPRILLEDPEKSYHAKHRVSDDDIFDNRLIFGDNLLALKALEAEFTGKVKCVFIDPPYTVMHNNNGFVKYNAQLFSWKDQARLATAIKAAGERGALIMMSSTFSAFQRHIFGRLARP